MVIQQLKWTLVHWLLLYVLYTRRFPVLRYGIKQPSERVENINSIFSLKLKSEKTAVNLQIVCTTATDDVTGTNFE